LSGYTNQVQGIALDLVNVANPNDDRLFVGGPTALDVYEASSSKDGPRSTEADKTVEGAATQLSPAIWGLALDPGRQILYVACTASVVVFASPTDPPSTIDGNEDPTRRLTGIGGPLGWLVVDPAFDVLYSTRGNGGGDTGVRVYNNASSLTGALTPDRTVGTSIRIFGFCIDFSRD
jgi:sugar lactone lactonase YvrE